MKQLKPLRLAELRQQLGNLDLPDDTIVLLEGDDTSAPVGYVDTWADPRGNDQTWIYLARVDGESAHTEVPEDDPRWIEVPR